jgi:hypothetical protein
MSQVTHDEWYWYQNEFWHVNPRGSGLRTDILQALLSQLDAMLNAHSKVFVFRFDLSIHYATDTNFRITAFNRSLFKWIKRHYGCQRIAYCWVREQEAAKNQHYHYALMLDGHKVRSPYRIQQWIEKIWEHYGRPHYSKYHNLSRGNAKAIREASYHVSYLAKPRGKGYKPVQTKNYGASRLKHLKNTSRSAHQVCNKCGKDTVSLQPQTRPRDRARLGQDCPKV